jgi:hypothetical protein
LTSENGSFSVPRMMLMRELVASRYGRGIARLFPEPGAGCDFCAAVRKSGSRFHRPSGVWTMLKLASSTLIRPISSRPRQSDNKRMDATTVLA